MRFHYPAPQADYIFQLTALSDSAFISADAANTQAAPFGALYYGGASAANIAVLPASIDTAVTFKNVQPGSTLPIAIRKVMNTNTTAAAADILVLCGKQGFQ